jgi:hypothetical protein
MWYPVLLKHWCLASLDDIIISFNDMYTFSWKHIPHIVFCSCGALHMFAWTEAVKRVPDRNVFRMWILASYVIISILPNQSASPKPKGYARTLRHQHFCGTGSRVFSDSWRPTCLRLTDCQDYLASGNFLG